VQIFLNTNLLKTVALLFAIILISTCASIAQEAEDRLFHEWLMNFNSEAQMAGISSQTIYNFMKDVKYLPKVIELDRKQPDKIKSFDQYAESALSVKKVKMARVKYQENKKLLDEIGRKYGVQPRFIVALWGSESDFGRNQGHFNVLNSLATLAFEGRRADFFKGELINALKIIDNENISPGDLKGSWAGAMGQNQFMPSSFLELAVDYDGDGQKDIWENKADMFASIANYLSTNGWDKNSTWGREVKLPDGFDENLIGKTIEKPISQWKELGVKNLNGKPLLIKKNLIASVVRVGEDDSARAFLIYPNYKILLKWNRSLYFASTIGLLADKIRN
jgi:membrane-bound lytic murein transglycosylase B